MFNLPIPLPLYLKITDNEKSQLVLEMEEVEAIAAALTGEMPYFVLVTNALPVERERELRRLADWNAGKPMSGQYRIFDSGKFVADEGKRS